MRSSGRLLSQRGRTTVFRHVRHLEFPRLGSPACDISDFSAVSPIVDAPSVKPDVHRRVPRRPPNRSPRRGTTPLQPNRNGNPPSGRRTDAGFHHDSPDGATRTCPAASRCRYALQYLQAMCVGGRAPDCNFVARAQATQAHGGDFVKLADAGAGRFDHDFRVVLKARATREAGCLPSSPLTQRAVSTSFERSMPVVDTSVVKHIDNVFRRNVSACARCERTATQTGHRGIEHRHARQQRGIDVRHAHAPGVVKMPGEPLGRYRCATCSISPAPGAGCRHRSYRPG
jgi:hypothetical protein